MPAKEKYMAQPPIEILRQWMDEGGWYDLETLEFKYLEDITFVAAMGPPSQGRNSISLRYSRHFNLIYVEPFLPHSLQRIFCVVMDWFFMNDGKDMVKACSSLSEKMVVSTIQIYNTIKLSKELLPTPAKSHYIYNLRDISKVFLGIARVIKLIILD
jgi:dynein heavy chain